MSVKQVGEYRFITHKKQMRNEKNKLPREIGNDCKNWFLLGFRKGGGQTDKSINGWDRRNYQTKADRRTKKKRGILILHGHLRDSIRVIMANFKKIVIGSNLPYSARHNEGLAGMPQREFIGHSKKLEQKIERKIGGRLKRHI